MTGTVADGCNTDLVRSKYRRSDAGGKYMEQNIGTTSDGVDWRYFPSLKAVASIKEVQRLPKVEDW